MDDEDKIILEVARFIWKNQISISEFYSVLGIDISDPTRSDPDHVIHNLAGILTGWDHGPDATSE